MDTMKRLIPALAFAGCIAMVAWALTLPADREPKRPLPPGYALVRPPHDVNVLLIEKNEVWAGGAEGVWVIDRLTLTARPVLVADDGPRYVRALLREAGGGLLIGHDGGVTRLIRGQSAPFDPTAPVPQGRVLSLLLARSGELWIGTERGAAVRDNSGWRVLGAKDGLLSDVVNAIAEDDDGGIWLGSYNVPGGGVTRVDAGRFQRWTPAEGLPHASVTSMLRDRGSRIWVGTGLLDRGGLACFEKGALGWRITQLLTQADGLAGAKVRSLFEDRGGKLWVGSEYEGLAFRDAAGWNVRRAIDGLAHNEVKAMAQDEDGAIWIGTKDGVTVIRVSS